MATQSFTKSYKLSVRDAEKLANVLSENPTSTSNFNQKYTEDKIVRGKKLVAKLLSHSKTS